jgi:hypothetical protein
VTQLSPASRWRIRTKKEEGFQAGSVELVVKARLQIRWLGCLPGLHFLISSWAS